MEPIYLDHNATTPLAPEVSQAITDALSLWGNPSSIYEYGRLAKEAIEKSREQVASMLNCKPSEIIFSSGGTESNNHVIWSVMESFRKWKVESGKSQFVPHVITTNVEHVAVEKPLKYWQENGELEVTTVPVDVNTGCVSIDAVMHALRPNTVLITVMMANNETGVLMPIREIGIEVKRHRLRREDSNGPPLFFHTDAAQAIGKIEVDVQELHVDYLVVVGHKFYGPRIGALYVRDLGNDHLFPMFFGGGQERGYRSGTENTPMIVGLGKAAELVKENLEKDQIHLEKCRDELEKCLKELFGKQIEFNFKNTPRLPNTTSVCLSTDGKVLGYDVLNRCSSVFASTGSACHSGVKPSAILMASGLSEEKARSTLRLTVGRSSTLDGMKEAAHAIKTAFDSV